MGNIYIFQPLIFRGQLLVFHGVHRRNAPTPPATKAIFSPQLVSLNTSMVDCLEVLGMDGYLVYEKWFVCTHI